MSVYIYISIYTHVPVCLYLYLHVCIATELKYSYKPMENICHYWLLQAKSL